MALQPAFFNNTLNVIDDTTNQLVVVQPFKPTSTGEQVEWQDSAEAMAWWETQKSLYTHYDVPGTPTE